MWSWWRDGDSLDPPAKEQPEAEAGMLPPLPSEPLSLMRRDSYFNPPAETVTIDDFDTNQSVLKPKHAQKLDELATSLAGTLTLYPATFISIAGHADAVDKPERNIELGQDRADAVLDYLANKGVASTAMRAVSLGESMLAVPTQQAEKRNRRVEITIHRRSLFNAKLLLDLKRPPVRFNLPPPPQPKIDLRVKELPPPRSDLDPSRFKLLPPPPQGMSAADWCGEKMRDAAKSLGLGKWAQERAESLGRKIPSGGAKFVIGEIQKETGMSPEVKKALGGVVDGLSEWKWK